MTRGGKRPGAGPKPNPVQRAKVTIRLPVELLVELRSRQKHKRDFSRVVEELIMRAINNDQSIRP
jgi:hypothetical protein